MVKKSTIYILLLLFCSCYPFPVVHNINHFDLRNKKKLLSYIKTDGYYYSVYNLNESYSKYRGEAIKMRVLLNNGYQHYVRNGYGDECGNTINLDCDIEMSEYMLDKYQNSNDRDYLKTYGVWNWGKYEVWNDTIIIKYFYNRFGDYYLVEEKGIVLDSSSFKILQIKDYRTNRVEKLYEFYQFKKYDVENMYNKIPEKLLSIEKRKNHK